MRTSNKIKKQYIPERSSKKGLAWILIHEGNTLCFIHFQFGMLPSTLQQPKLMKYACGLF